MGRRSRKSRNEEGVLDGGIVVWKPRGPSSRAVVNRAQRLLGFRGLGHCGTLDPLASGVMVLTGGMGSKFQHWLTVHDKVYEATIWWGIGSDSGDAEGPLWSPAQRRRAPTAEEVKSVLPQFLGEQDQVPPIHSAIRIGGRRSFKNAREGKTMELPSRRVRIDALELLELDGDQCRVRVECGPGTYIRSLARDLGEALGIPAMLMGLRRLSCGIHTLENAVLLDRVCRDHWWSLERLVAHLPQQKLTPAECQVLAQGQQISATETAERMSGDRVAWSQGSVQGIIEDSDEGFKARRWLSRGLRETDSRNDLT
ncbi:tRNA pseudouridine(55) synthase TruB [bacterium TMED181]|nr:tRNA pseudouridine(55) synthase TruB [Planctomycetota bacterium]OUW46054.1 MAG: tRNA pseudouridine(55) synthase TruB [bacterium TMED181]